MVKSCLISRLANLKNRDVKGIIYKLIHSWRLNVNLKELQLKCAKFDNDVVNGDQYLFAHELETRYTSGTRRTRNIIFIRANSNIFKNMYGGEDSIDILEGMYLINASGVYVYKAKGYYGDIELNRRDVVIPNYIEPKNIQIHPFNFIEMKNYIFNKWECLNTSSTKLELRIRHLYGYFDITQDEFDRLMYYDKLKMIRSMNIEYQQLQWDINMADLGYQH